MDRTQFGNYVRVAGPAPVAVANLYQAPVTETFGISNSMLAIVNTIIFRCFIFYHYLLALVFQM